jgi:hypothetical protein
MKRFLLGLAALAGLSVAGASSAQAAWGVNVNVGPGGCAPGVVYQPVYNGYVVPQTSWIGPGYGTWNYSRPYYGYGHYGHHHHGHRRW